MITYDLIVRESKKRGSKYLYPQRGRSYHRARMLKFLKLFPYGVKKTNFKVVPKRWSLFYTGA